ncbi:MAG: L,D-transpeptidase [Thermomicrobiales bacterium]
MGSVFIAGVAAPERTYWESSRRMILALVLVLTGMLGSMTSFAPTASAGTAGTIVVGGAALLSDPGDYTILDYMEYGSRVDVLYGPFNDMYEILYYGVHGYVFADKIAVDGGGGTATYSEEAVASDSAVGSSGSGATQINYWASPSWVVIDNDLVNVRADAGTWADVWDSYPGGTWVAVVGSSVNGFAPIEYGNGIAWISEQNLSWNGTTSYDAVPAAAAGTGGMTSSGGGERWIDINRTSGLVTLFVGDSVQATYWASLSRDQSADGFYTTALGTWYVTRKYEPLAFTKYANAYITHWVAFDESRDNGFHSYLKDQYGNILPNGSGFTGGCVALNPEGAEAVFNFAYVGMRVEVHL